MDSRLRTSRLIFRTTSTSSGTGCRQGATFHRRCDELEIPKVDGGTRPLGIPTVADRIAQEVARRYLEPRLEPMFHTDSYGYRPGRSAIDAVRQARKRCWRYDWVLDLDVKAYFDSIDWALMLRVVRRCAPTAPISPYGSSKLTEIARTNYARYDCIFYFWQTIYFKLANVFRDENQKSKMSFSRRRIAIRCCRIIIVLGVTLVLSRGRRGTNSLVRVADSRSLEF
jgi:hypothetical protein